MSQVTAILYILSIAVVILFQFCLILGMPWGPYTQGGQCAGALGLKGRIIAFVSVFVLLFMAAAIASAAGLPPYWPGWTAWLATGIQLLSTLLNWITPSVPERRIWGPITSLLSGLAIVTLLS